MAVVANSFRSSFPGQKTVIMFPYLSFYLFMQMNRERLMKMAGAVRTGGKGSVRRCVSVQLKTFNLATRAAELIF